MAALAALAVPVGGQDRSLPVGGQDRTLPASGQDRDTPKSLLPEGFDTPAAAPAQQVVLPGAISAPVSDDALPADPLAEAAAQPDPFAEAASGRDISGLGLLTPAAGGYGPAIFAGADGRFLAGLARRIAAPGASRWAAIVLRRALLSQAQAPSGITPGDWVAARAGLLLRIGEIDGAHRLAGAVPVDRYTPALYRVAAQTALAAGDIAGLCPIAETGRALWPEAEWDLGYGMCAAIAGDDITAASVFDALRRDRRINRFDLRLAERVSTLAGGAGRASGINWNEVDGLTLYRFGVASAAGLTVPPERLAALGPARAGWLVRNDGIAPDVRLSFLRAAAAIGTLSTAELVGGVSALSPVDAAGGYADDSRAGRLRAAFDGGDARRRSAAMARVRADVAAGGDGYGALLETAAAAARLPVTPDLAEASPDIIAALLAAGDSAAARRWWPVSQLAGSAARARAWALLATGSGGVPVTPDAFDDWKGATGASDRSAAILLAGLAGLGAARGSDWQALLDQYLPRPANSWTRAIDAAGRTGRIGDVAILAATGLQGAWRDVPAAHLFHIIANLARSGRQAEARLVAAEAVSRATAPSASATTPTKSA